MKEVLPTFSTEDSAVQLYHGDALSILNALPAESFDLIFADPPYFLSNGGQTCRSGRWVSVNKGEWDRSPGFDQEIAFTRTWLTACRRLLRPDGCIWVCGTMHNIFLVGHVLRELEYKILNDIIWHKIDPPPNLGCRCFVHATETLIWAKKSKRSRQTFNYDTLTEVNGGKPLESVWRLRAPDSNERLHGQHPTQKPVLLTDRILEACSQPGNIVLDPFCGSGTMGVSCARLGRRFVGIDQSRDFIELSWERIQDIFATEEADVSHNAG